MYRHGEKNVTKPIAPTRDDGGMRMRGHRARGGSLARRCVACMGGAVSYTMLSTAPYRPLRHIRHSISGFRENVERSCADMGDDTMLEVSRDVVRVA